jgi:hypothetical protein
VGSLLARSRPFRGLLILVIAAAAVVMTTTTCIGALSWSPQQTATSVMGRAEAVVAPFGTAERLPLGSELSSPAWTTAVNDEVGVFSVWSAMIPLGRGDTFWSNVGYSELLLPSLALEGRIELTQGLATRSGRMCRYGLGGRQGSDADRGVVADHRRTCS